MDVVDNNRFIASLSAATRTQLLSTCSLRDLPVGACLYAPDEQAKYVYFLTSGIASVVVSMPEGDAAEVLLIGKEGLTASVQLLGPACVSTTCFVQLAATGLRMRFSDLKVLFHTSAEIRSRVLEFAQHNALSLSQLAGCNQFHSAGERLARWLLMAQDRTGEPTLNFTQDFLGQMLGLQRTTVTAIVGVLQETEIIDYPRGRLTIVDRPSLELSACSCYSNAHRLFDGLYRRTWASC